jgi:hypothetical protein
MNNVVFVFGSNRQGRHGAGAALEAKRRFGAVTGQAEGRQGRSYAVITKELRRDMPAVTLKEIKEGVDRLLQHARENPEDTFMVTPVGCGLAGFSPKEIAPMFAGHPKNMLLPVEFKQEV